MKKICFFIGTCNDRNGEWNGEIIRNGGVGVSGTDTSTVLIAEYFAKYGWDTYLIASSCKNNTIYNNVKYYKCNILKEINNEFDILVITPSDEFLEYKWNNLQKIIIWCHMQHTFKESSFQSIQQLYPKTSIIINYMNQFVKDAVAIHSPYTTNYTDDFVMIPNPVFNDNLNNNIVKKPHSFIFNTSYRRGGDVLLNIFNKVNYDDKSLVVCSAYKGELDKVKGNNNIEILNSIDKYTMFKKLAESEYFVYPLVTPLSEGANLHKDCSPCSVAEALLNEVIVITLPVAGLNDLYKDILVYMPFPDENKIMWHKSGYHSSGNEFYSEDFVEKVVSIIDFLEKNPHYKELLKKRGKQFVYDNFNLEYIGTQWLKIL
jgi:hypothetical protein